MSKSASNDKRKSPDVLDEVEATDGKAIASTQIEKKQKLDHTTEAAADEIPDKSEASTRTDRGQILSNPGAGDCGVYAVIQAMEDVASNKVSTEQLQEVRNEISHVMRGFLNLFRYKQSLSTNAPDAGEVRALYSAIFNDFEVFRYIAGLKLSAPLDGAGTNAETKANLRTALEGLQQSTDWDSLPDETIQQIFHTCNLFDVDVRAAIDDHNTPTYQALSSSCSSEKYAAYVANGGTWLDNNELIGYLLTQGYVWIDREVSSNCTIFRFKNTEGRIIGLHNNAQDRNTKEKGAGTHWQAVVFKDSYNEEQEEKTPEETIFYEKAPPVDLRFDISNPLTSDGLTSTLHGVVYQRALLTLAAIRAHAKKFQFHLISEAKEFEKFDDLVIDYGNEIDKITYLQAKHGSSEEGIFSKRDFCSGDYDNPAGLAKYFDSWYRLRNSKYSRTNTQYIFFTNKGVDKNAKHFLEETEVEGDDFLFEGLKTNTYKVVQGHARSELIDAITANSKVVQQVTEHTNLERIDLDILKSEVIRVKEYLGIKAKELKNKTVIIDGRSYLSKKEMALIQLATTEKTFAEKLLEKESKILKWIEDTKINIKISNPLDILLPPMLSEINTFLDEFIIKIEQPNRHDLAEIIFGELRYIADIGTRELNNTLNDYMWEWLSDRSTCLLKSENFGKFVEIQKNDLDRFYLLDSTRIFKEECESGIVGLEQLPLLKKVREFLVEKKQRIAIVQDNGGGANQQIYGAIKRINIDKGNFPEFKDDEWSFLHIDSWYIKQLHQVLKGQSSKFYTIDCRLEQINDEQLVRLQALCQVTRQNGKKLILLITPKQDDLLGKLAGETKEDRGDFIEFESQPLTDEQIRDIGAAHAAKNISLAGKEYSVKEIIDRKIGSVYELMRDVKYLTQIIECAHESRKPVKSEIPYGVYVPNRMSRGEVYYDLSIITKKVADFYIVENIEYRRLKSALEVLFREQRREEKFSTRKEFTEKPKSEFVLLQDSGDLSRYGDRVIILTERPSVEVLDGRKYLSLKSLGSNKFQITENPSNLHLPFSNDIEFPNQDKQKECNKTIIPRGQLSVIMSPAGYGKTSFCQKMLEEHQFLESRVSPIWMVKIPLTKLQFDGDCPNLIQFLGLDYEWQRVAWERDRKIKGRVFIILDGFDEVKSIEAVKLINKLIGDISTSTSLLITTREYAANKLKLPDGRSSTFYRLEQYTEKQRVDYIKEYVKAILPKTEKSKEFKSFVRWITDTIQSKIAEHPSGVLGIPLESYIFCELYKPYILAYVKQNGYELAANGLDDLEEVDVSNMAKLYQEFILSKSKIFLEKHLGINPDSIKNKGILFNLMGSYNQIIEIYALKQAFELSYDKIEKYVEGINFSRAELETIKYTGLLSVAEDGSALDFNHETYQEFYAALAIIRGILSDKGELHILVNSLVKKHRYDPKFYFTFSMASQFSVAAGPMVPGYSVGKHVSSFWILLGDDGDVLGVASISLFEYCTREFTSGEKLLLKKELLLGGLQITKWLKFLQAALNSRDSTAQEPQRDDDQEILPISEEDDSDDYGREIDTSKEVVAAVFRGLRNKGKLTQEAVRQLELTTDDHKKQFDYWALDGGIEAIGYTGQFFSKKLAKYLISRSNAWVNNKCLALEALISIYRDTAEHTEARENCFFVMKNLFLKSVGANNEKSFVDLLDTAGVGFLNYLKNDLLQLLAVGINLDIAEVDLATPSSIFKEPFDAMQRILLAAEKLKYAVLIDESKQQITLLKETQIEIEFPKDERGKIFADLILGLLRSNFDSSDVIDCFNAVQLNKIDELTLQKIEKYFVSQLQDDELFDQYCSSVVKNKYRLLLLYKKLFGHRAITKHSVEKYTEELSTDKATERLDFWSFNVGIEIAGYTGIYFNKEIANYLKSRDIYWPNKQNKQKIQEALAQIFRTLTSSDIDKSQDEYMVAVEAYNECILSSHFSNLEQIELYSSVDTNDHLMDVDSQDSHTESPMRVLGDSPSDPFVMEE